MNKKSQTFKAYGGMHTYKTKENKMEEHKGELSGKVIDTSPLEQRSTEEAKMASTLGV